MAIRGTRSLGLVAALLSVVLAGCTDSPGGGGSDEGDDGAEEAPADGPYAGLAPGVEEALRGDPSAPAISGVVYDLDTGTAIAGATVTATCLRGALPASSETVTTGAAGTFGFAAQPGLLGCVSLTYAVESTSYTLGLPLVSPPIVEGVQYVVNAGMTSS